MELNNFAYQNDSSFCCAMLMLDGRYDIKEILEEISKWGLSIIYYDCSKMTQKQFNEKFKKYIEECSLFIRVNELSDCFLTRPSLKVLVWDKEGKAIEKMSHILPPFYVSRSKKMAAEDTVNFFGNNIFDLIEQTKDFFLEDYALSLSRATDDFKKEKITPNYIDSIIKKCQEIMNGEHK